MATMANENGKLKFIPLAKIRENPVAIRTVNKKTEDYLGLVDSIRAKGVLQPILVREIKNPETGEMDYGLINGLQRTTAARDAGLTDIPALIKSIDEGNIIEAQIITNLHTIETKLVEYAKGLQRILTQNPTLTQEELAQKINKSAEWISQRLHLTNLTSGIQELVNTGKINATNAINLAKLPPEEQTNFVDRAMTMSPQEFVPLSAARVKQIRDDKRKGKQTGPEEFVALPKLRSIKDIKEEKDVGNTGLHLIRKSNVTSPVEAWKLAMAWTLQLDPDAVEERRVEDEKRKAAKEVEKEKIKKEKAEKKAREAAEKAAALTA